MTQNIELTKDTLTNIHIMASLLDDIGRASAFGFMYGLIAREGAEKQKDDTTDFKKTG